MKKEITITLSYEEAFMIMDALEPFKTKRNPPYQDRKSMSLNTQADIQMAVWTLNAEEKGRKPPCRAEAVLQCQNRRS